LEGFGNLGLHVIGDPKSRHRYDHLPAFSRSLFIRPLAEADGFALLKSMKSVRPTTPL
jgi:hypothetical protein